jgi:hypothetical protein
MELRATDGDRRDCADLRPERQIFSDTGTYTSQAVEARVLGPGDAERLVAAGYLHDAGMIAGVLVPVIAGMFFGVLLLAIALWRSTFPRGPVVLLALWPIWDFFGPTQLGPSSSSSASPTGPRLRPVF